MNAVASRTPEGQPLHCQVCDAVVHLETSLSHGDAVCPICGSLLWGDALIAPDQSGVSVARPQRSRLQICTTFLRELLDEWHLAGGAVWHFDPDIGWQIVGALGETLLPSRMHLWEELFANVTTFGPAHLAPKGKAELNHPQNHRVLAAAGPFLVVDILLRPVSHESAVKTKLVMLRERVNRLLEQLNFASSELISTQQLEIVVDDLLHYSLREATHAIEALSHTAQSPRELLPGFLSYIVGATRAQAGVLWELTLDNTLQLSAIQGSIPNALLSCVWHDALLREGLDVSPCYLKTPLGGKSVDKVALLFSRVLRPYGPPLLLELVEPTLHQPSLRQQVRFLTSACKLVERSTAWAGS